MQIREQLYSLHFLLIFTDQVSRHLCLTKIIQGKQELSSSQKGLSKGSTTKSPFMQVHGTWWDVPEGAERADVMSLLSIIAERPLQSGGAPHDLKASLAPIFLQSNKDDSGQ